MDLKDVSGEQKEIILNNEGPMLVIAGPGTGKTFTLVKKIVYLLTVKKLSPESIVVTTFTNKAANELKTRIGVELHKAGFIIDTSKLKIGTIHSVALKIIDLKNIIIMESFEQKYFIYKNMGTFRKIQGFSLLENYLDSLKGGFLYNLQQLFNIFSENSVIPNKIIISDFKLLRVAGLLYSTYLYLLKCEDILDFSQIQSKCLEILENDQEILEKLREEIKYIIVDEYQDTNNLQNKILLKLCNDENNICVVGDDDQSIYRFRGAEVKNIINFPTFFQSSQCRVFYLSNNYRSPQEIIEFYSDFMEPSIFKGNRYEKNLVAVKDVEGSRVFKVSAKNQNLLGEEIGIFIKKLLESGVINNLSEVTFLFKTTKYGEARVLEEEFKKLGLPVFSPRTGELFKKEEVMIVIGMTLSIFREFSQEIFKKEEEQLLPHEIYYKKCINKFSEFLQLQEKKIDKNKMENNESNKVSENNEDNENSNGNNCQKKGTKDFKNYIKKIAKQENFVDFFYETLQFKEMKNIFSWNKEDDLFEQDKKQQKHKNIALILNMISEYETKNGGIYSTDFFTDYLPFLLECGINEFEDTELLSLDGHISFLTFHQSKGLEFPLVFLGSLDQSPKKFEKNKIVDVLYSTIIYPLNYDFSNQEAQDFYRLYYTGFSRAKEFLFLISKDNRLEDTDAYKAPSSVFQKPFDNLVLYENFFEDNINFKLNKTKEIRNKRLFSYTTDMAIYSQCPVKYRFFRDIGFPQKRGESEFFGTLIHSTIEDLHDIYNKNGRVNSHIIREILIKNYKFLKRSYGYSIDQKNAQKATSVINEYIHENKKNLENIVGNEVSLTTVRDKYILSGVIDIIKQLADESFEIIDIKTNDLKPEEIPNNYREQLLVYSYLCQRNGYNIEKLSLYFTANSENPKTTFIPQKNEMENILNKFDSVVEKILKKDFYERCLFIEECQRCELNYYCNH